MKSLAERKADRIDRKKKEIEAARASVTPAVEGEEGASGLSEEDQAELDSVGIGSPGVGTFAQRGGSISGANAETMDAARFGNGAGDGITGDETGGGVTGAGSTATDGGASAPAAKPFKASTK